MGARDNLQRLADRKQAEIADLRAQIDRATIYLQAIQDSIKALPRESALSSERSTEEVTIRPGSHLAKAQEAIKQNGRPMYIGDLLQAIGVENTKGARVSLVGSLGTYVRRKAVFTRPKPNTFGLIGMNPSGHAAEHLTESENDGAEEDETFSLHDEFGK